VKDVKIQRLQKRI